jgi:prepilin-type N-terminal cleavage/methylation domain-containing protein
MLNNKGFTLIELVVVMGIFIGVMMMTSYAFENILKKGGQQARSAESQIEGIVGLEMLRGDLEHAGYGLPWSLQTPPGSNYVEVTTDPVTGITAAAYNEKTPSAIRIDTIDASGAFPGSDYLVIKSSVVGMNNAARKWTYVNYSATTAGVNSSNLKLWGTGEDFTVTEDRVITISSTFTATGEQDKRLAMTSGGAYSYTVPTFTPPARPQPTDDAYKPADASQLFVVYGIDKNDLRMPYNRADYYVRRPSSGDAVKFPESCNPNTGILFKGVVQQGTTLPGGTFTEYPLLNCVGDLQVEFELDRENDGNATFSTVLKIIDEVTLSLRDMTPKEIRTQLKNVRVYILAQEGKKDGNYSFVGNSILVGDPARPSTGRTLDSSAMNTKFGADWRNYRWKVYTIVVRPKSLN